MNERHGGHYAPTENQNETTREFSPQEQETLRTVDEIHQRSGPDIAQRALEAFMADLHRKEAAVRLEKARELVAATQAAPKERRSVPINFTPPADITHPREGADLSEQGIRASVHARYHK